MSLRKKYKKDWFLYHTSRVSLRAAETADKFITRGSKLVARSRSNSAAGREILKHKIVNTLKKYDSPPKRRKKP